MNELARGWWVTFRYGSRFTKAGRELRRMLREPMSEFVEPGCPVCGYPHA